jgi:DNA-binding NarL/FixJ family response regulator
MNIVIIDKCNAYALGVRNTLSKFFKKDDEIIIQTSFNLLDFGTNNIDMLFLDSEFLLDKKTMNSLKSLRSKLPNLKLIILSEFISKINQVILTDIQPNGIFPKRLSRLEFKYYLRKVMKMNVFIDYHAIENQIASELKFVNSRKLKFDLPRPSLMLINPPKENSIDTMFSIAK